VIQQFAPAARQTAGPCSSQKAPAGCAGGTLLCFDFSLLPPYHLNDYIQSSMCYD
jgi:hypothetical protein